VRNINDHQPQFPLDVFQVNITGKSLFVIYPSVFCFLNCFVVLEHDPSLEIIQLPETVDLDEPDELLSTRDPVCYFIVGGNQLGAFSIDPTQHTLRVHPLRNVLTTKTTHSNKKNSRLRKHWIERS
jgi:hypothetical protein